MKRMRKIISMFLVMAIMLSFVPIIPVYADSVDVAIQSRIDELYSLLGNTYFTTDRQPAGSSDNRSLNKSIIQQTWFKEMFGITSLSVNQFPGSPRTYPEAKSCSGFATFAEWYIFKKSNSDYITINELPKMQLTPENVMNNAKIGDIISLSGTKPNGYTAGHEFIFISADASGMYVLDSNWGNDCKVTKHYINYDYCSHFQIGRATNRSDVTPSIPQFSVYYTTTLKGNGGTPETQAVKSVEGSTISLPTPTAPTGYEFNGWYTAASGGTYVSGGSNYTVYGNLTLYAQWRVKKYLISYNANGGSYNGYDQTKEYGKSVTLTSTKPTRSGYTFLGWSTSPTATVASYKAGDTYSSNANITLYAVWKANPPSITASKTNISLNYESNRSETITFSVSGQLPEDYKLYASWDSGVTISWGEWNGTTTSATITATQTTACTPKVIVSLRDGNDNVYATTTINVSVAGIYRTITYSANGGYNAPSSQQVPGSYGSNTFSADLKSQIPKRDGYTFIGWSANSSDVIAEYAAGDHITIEKDTTLYAIWHKTEFSIIVNRDLNGGTGATTRKVINIDLDDYNFALTGPRICLSGVYIDNTSDVFPTKDGYIFSGWKGVLNAKRQYNVYSKNTLYIGFDYDDEVTLTAAWVKNMWTGDVAEEFAGGIGTKENPYIIENVAQLAKLSYDVAGGTSYADTYFELANDIDMESNSTWLPIGYSVASPFEGNFNGNNYTIDNLKAKAYDYSLEGTTTDYFPIGLFGYCKDAELKNIVFDDAYISNGNLHFSYMGTLAGRVENCDIESINTSGSRLSFTDDYDNVSVGDIVGYAINSTINGCSSTGAFITAKTGGNIYAGGIVGHLSGNGKIMNCYNRSGEISLTTANMTCSIGGICGVTDTGSTTENCLVESGYLSGYNGALTGSYTYAGGVVGWNKGDVVKCLSNDCEIQSVGFMKSYAGGVVGRNASNGYISQCMTVGDKLFSRTNTTEGFESLRESYEWAGHIVALHEGSIGSGNYYDSAGVITRGYNVKTVGTAKTSSQLINYQSAFVGFSGFSAYENGTGTLWEKESGEFAIMYKTSDFKTIRVESASNGKISTDVTRALNGTVVNITATPDSGYHLKEIYVNGVLQSDISKFTVNGNAVIRPIFEADKVSVSIYAGNCDNGTIKLSNGTAYIGDTVTVTATPDEHYVLDSIFVDGNKISGNSFMVTGNHVVTAKFTAKSYNLTVVNQSGGTLTLNKNIAKYGEVVTVTAVPKAGYKVGTILVDDEGIESNTFVVSGNHTISCEWELAEIYYTISVQSAINGSVAVDRTVAEKGRIIVVYPIPDDGYETDKIYVNNVAIEGNTFVLNEDSVVTATFSKVDAPETNIYTYTVSSGKATITKCDTSVSGEVVIPSTLGGYPVTSIGDNAFSNCTNITSIDIPDDVTNIGSGAFYYCSNLKCIYIPAAVSNIGEFAFGQCDKLSDVYYQGTESQWKKISIGDFNESLTDATLYCAYGLETEIIKSTDFSDTSVSVGSASYVTDDTSHGTVITLKSESSSHKSSGTISNIAGGGRNDRLVFEADVKYVHGTKDASYGALFVKTYAGLNGIQVGLNYKSGTVSLVATKAEANGTATGLNVNKNKTVNYPMPASVIAKGEGKWITITIDHNVLSQTYQVYIDGQLINEVPILQANMDLGSNGGSAIRGYSLELSQGGEMWVDNVSLKKYSNKDAVEVNAALNAALVTYASEEQAPVLANQELSPYTIGKSWINGMSYKRDLDDSGAIKVDNPSTYKFTEDGPAISYEIDGKNVNKINVTKPGVVELEITAMANGIMETKKVSRKVAPVVIRGLALGTASSFNGLWLEGATGSEKVIVVKYNGKKATGFEIFNLAELADNGKSITYSTENSLLSGINIGHPKYSDQVTEVKIFVLGEHGISPVAHMNDELHD